MNLEIHGPDPTARVRANRAGLRALVLDTQPELISRVIQYEERIVGGFIVAPPGGFPLASPSLWRQIGCLRHQGAHAMDRWAHVGHELGQMHPVEEHWYLAILGVRPELQGRGLGSRLLAALFRLIERRPAPLYLESDRLESVRFYRSRGLVERDRIAIYGLSCWCLGRGFPDERPDLCDSVREGLAFQPEPPPRYPP